MITSRESSIPHQQFDTPPLRFFPGPQKKRSGIKPIRYVLLSIVFVSCYSLISFNKQKPLPVPPVLSQEALQEARLDLLSPFTQYPRADSFQYGGYKIDVSYTADSAMQSAVHAYLDGYKPNVGVYMVADLATGKILALGEREDSLIQFKPRLALGGEYPAASILKIVTALTALQHGISPEDSIVQIGRYHTLYKYQLRLPEKEPVPRIPLHRAFAYSVNPAFALLGMEMGAEALTETATKLGYNREEALGLVPSHIQYPESGFHLGELSCGYTKKATLSPWHALEMARAIGHDGRLIAAQLVDEVKAYHHQSGTVRWQPEAEQQGAIPKEHLGDLRAMMESVIHEGTARRSFYKILRWHHMENLVIGGKTGSLNGLNPEGRYDWFMGYAKLKQDPTRGIAVVVMQVHQSYQTLVSSRVAALIIRKWYRESTEDEQPATLAGH